MNSSTIKGNLENAKTQIVQTEVRLRITEDLEAGLELQTKLLALQRYQTRLETELVEVERLEDISKKERENIELSARIAELEAKHSHVQNSAKQAVQAVIPQLEELLATLKPLRNERLKLNAEHQSLWLERYGSYVQKPLSQGIGLISAEGSTETEQVVELALELLESEKTKTGTRYADVIRAVSTQSMRYGV